MMLRPRPSSCNRATTSSAGSPSRSRTEDIFEQVPEATLIYTWSADSRRWRYVIRDVGGSLETLDSGTAAVIRIDGRRTVKWERPLTPAKGGITLYAGVNWVAWNGRDDWPLDQVARGIGTSLISIEVHGQLYRPGEETTIAPLRRGDALRVTVNRDLRWLQPTGMMPKIVWVGDISETLQQEIIADIRRVLDFYGEHFAIESDFSETTVMLYSSIDAAVEYAESGATPQFSGSPKWLRALLTNSSLGAATAWGFYVPTCTWQPPCWDPSYQRPLELVSHEWFHVLQYQLSAGLEWGESPQWMNEGTAMWMHWQLPSDWRHAPLDNVREFKIEQAARTLVSLRSVEERNGPWQHQLGQLAAERLANLSGADSHIEYIRLLLPQTTGTAQRWVDGSDWQEAFEAAYGISSAAFYEDFAAWRKTLPAPAHRYDYYPGDLTLSGTLRDHNGNPAAEFALFTTPFLDGVHHNAQRVAMVDEEGSFSIDVSPETILRIWFRRDGCTLWLTNEGLTIASLEEGQYRDLDTRDLPELNLIVPEGDCENELQINIIRLRDGEHSASVYLRVAESNEQVQSRYDQHSGATFLWAPKPGAYRARVRIDGCELSYTKEGLVPSWRVGDVLELSDQPVSIEFRMPHDLCVRRIRGRIVQEDGTGVGGVWLHMHHGDMYSSDQVSADGRFNMLIPDAGDYVLNFRTDVDGCTIYYSMSGAASKRQEATSITVADSDVTGIEFVVPDDPASLCR